MEELVLVRESAVFSLGSVEGSAESEDVVFLIGD